MSSHKDSKYSKSRWEKIRNLKSKRACIKTLKSKTLESKTIDTNSLVAEDAEIGSLNVDRILFQGRDLTCVMTLPTLNTALSEFEEFGSTGPVGVNPTVYNCLLQNAVAERDDLQDRLLVGRQIIADFLNNYPCPPTCPPGVTGPVELEIYGTKTFPIFRRIVCLDQGATGVTGSTGNIVDSVLNNVSFNLDVDYQLEVAESVNPRVVSVLVQIGYIDPNGPTGGCTETSENVVIETVYIGNRQFGPTLDIEFGENYARTISLPSDVLQAAIAAMPDPTNTGAVQMVVFKEKGVCIWGPTSEGFECRGGSGTTNNASAGATSQTQANCTPVCTQDPSIGLINCVPCGDQ